MNEKTPNFGPEISPETREKIKSLSNTELAFGIGLALNHKYDFGGYSVGRSERSYLLNFFLALNTHECNAKVQKVNPWTNTKGFISEMKERAEKIEITEDTGKEIDINNEEMLSAVILNLWITHYREKVEALKDAAINNNTDFSYGSEIGSAELLYKMYISELDVSDADLENAGRQFINPAYQGGSNPDPRIQKYTNELGWKVDELTVAENMYLDDLEEEKEDPEE